ncbi:MAG TPA: hypothetical protein VGK48_26130 [Terriglobia bacterium]|jgi:hypothetical protein
MNNPELDGNDMPSEIDFSKGTRGLHHIPAGATVFMPVSVEKTVWKYFSDKARQRGMPLSDLITEVLKHDIEINEALK